MATRKSAGKKKKETPIATPVVETPLEATSEVDSLREYALEAELVENLKQTPGWQILERDLRQYLNAIGAKLPYLSPKLNEYTEARILYISSDKLIKMIEDYSENRKRAVELLARLDNTKDNIVLDVDN